MRRALPILFCLVPLVLAVTAATRASFFDDVEPVVDAVPARTVAPWKAVAASGTVEAQPVSQEIWLQVRRGDELRPRTTLRTGRKSRTTLVRRADVLIVDAESHLELPDAASRDASAVVQESGSVLYEVEGGEGRDFRVITPHLVAGVKGTVFLVTVTERWASVTVEQGEVQITSVRTGEQHDLGPGETIMVDVEREAEMELVSAGQDGTMARLEARRKARDERRRIDRGMQRRDRDLVRYLQWERRSGALRDGRLSDIADLLADESDPNSLHLLLLAGGDAVPRTGDIAAEDELSEDHDHQVNGTSGSSSTRPTGSN